jgi:hypothetical protein
MNSKEISRLVAKQLPLILRGGTYYHSYHSNLSTEQWDALKTRLVEEGLAIEPAPYVLSLTHIGQSVAAKGKCGYRKFVKQRNREKNAPSTANRIATWALILTAVGIVIAYLDYSKPDKETSDKNPPAKEPISTSKQVSSSLIARDSTRKDSAKIVKQDTVAKPAPHENDTVTHSKLPASGVTQPKRN